MRIRILFGLALALATVAVTLSVAEDSKDSRSGNPACAAKTRSSPVVDANPGPCCAAQVKGTGAKCCTAACEAACALVKNECCSDCPASCGDVETTAESGCPLAAKRCCGEVAGGCCSDTSAESPVAKALRPDEGCCSGGCAEKPTFALTALQGESGAEPAGCPSGKCPVAATEGSTGSCCAGKNRVAEATESPVICPVSGEPAAKDVSVSYNGGVVHFKCKGCKAKFEKSPDKYAAKANLQLVSTGQATQVACPVSGKKCNEGTKLSLAGVDVRFFCKGCRASVAKAEPDAQLELVFGNEPFKTAFEVKKPPVRSAEKLSGSEQAKKEQPTKKG